MGGPHDRAEIARRGKALYERRVREEVEAGGAKEGRFLAIDVDSGDYEVADDALRAGAGKGEQEFELPAC